MGLVLHFALGCDLCGYEEVQTCKVGIGGFGQPLVPHPDLGQWTILGSRLICPSHKVVIDPAPGLPPRLPWCR